MEECLWEFTGGVQVLGRNDWRWGVKRGVKGIQAGVHQGVKDGRVQLKRVLSRVLRMEERPKELRGGTQIGPPKGQIGPS